MTNSVKSSNHLITLVQCTRKQFDELSGLTDKPDSSELEIHSSSTEDKIESDLEDKAEQHKP